MIRSSPGRRERGYSFTEVLVAISLIGLSTMIAIPNLQAGLRSVRLEASSRQVLRLLRVARMVAMASQDEYEFSVNGNGQIAIRNLADGTIEPGYENVALPPVRSVAVDNPASHIQFNRDGTAPFGGTIIIEGAGNSGMLRVEVYRSGLARIVR